MRSDDGGAAAAAVEAAAAHYARMLFLQRLRTPGNRAALARLFAATWGAPLGEPARISVAVSPALLRVGRAALPRAGAWEDPGARGARDHPCAWKRFGSFRCNQEKLRHIVRLACFSELDDAQQRCAAAHWVIGGAGCVWSTQWLCLEAY